MALKCSAHFRLVWSKRWAASYMWANGRERWRLSCAQDWNELMKKKKTNYKRLLSDSYSLDWSYEKWCIQKGTHNQWEKFDVFSYFLSFRSQSCSFTPDSAFNMFWAFFELPFDLLLSSQSNFSEWKCWKWLAAVSIHHVNPLLFYKNRI